MSPFDNLPQRDSTHDTEEEAITAFRAAVDACKLFVVQREDRNDYGTDVQIEARDNKAMTNIRAHVQLKGTKSVPNANGSVSVEVARANLNYLLAQADSLYVCYHLPSDRLLVRYAEDVYREYEHRGGDWDRQYRVTVNLRQPFDVEFQRRLNARLLASGKSSRHRRLQWIVTPPEQIPTLVRRTTAIIEVAADPVQASEILAELYRAGNDAIISNSFAQFAAVLDSLPGAMDLAYMAEINLGINGSSFDKDRVRQGIRVLYEAMKRGDFHPGSLLYCVGNAWLALGEYDKARDDYLVALTQLDTPELSAVAAQCSKNLGSALEGLHEMDEARASYERALELDSDLGEAHFALALWHRRKGDDPGSALEHLNRVIPLGGSALQMSVVQGWRIELLLNAGDTEGAFREINSLLARQINSTGFGPGAQSTSRILGRSPPMRLKRRSHSGVPVFVSTPWTLVAERERLLCLWRLRTAGVQTEISLDGFTFAVIKLIEGGDPDPSFLWDRVGHWAQCDKEWVRAESANRNAYDLEPTRYGYCLGTALNFLSRYREALSLLLPQAEEYQADAMSWFQVARAREGIGDINGSISAYERALELDPDYDLAWFNLGGMYWNSRDVERATEKWREAVRRFPNHELAGKLRRELPFLFEPNHNEQGC